jgi:hypothetical protein
MKHAVKVGRKPRHYHGRTPKMLSGIKAPLQVEELHTYTVSLISFPLTVILIGLASIGLSHTGQFPLVTFSPP